MTKIIAAQTTIGAKAMQALEVVLDRVIADNAKADRQ